MNRRLLAAAALGAGLLLSGPVLADQDRPPAGSLAASEVLRQVEQRPDFASLHDMEWDDDGYWEIEYVTRDGGKRTVRLDPRTGAPRSR